MLSMIKKFLRVSATDLHHTLPDQASTDTLSSNAVMSDPFFAGKQDSVIEGRYNYDTSSLYPNFEITEKDTVLDVGCGESGVIDFCAALGAAVAFVDIDPQKVEQKKQSLINSKAKEIHGFVSDANPLPLPDNFATRVVSTEVLEHVDHPEVFLNELVRVGAANARYMITVPAPASEKAQIGIAAPQYFEKPNHIRIIEVEQFKKMVEDAGLVVESHDQQGFYWSVWWMFFWVCDNQDLSPPWNPLLVSWANTWHLLLQSPRAAQIKKALDAQLPKQQIIIAHKPG